MVASSVRRDTIEVNVRGVPWWWSWLGRPGKRTVTLQRTDFVGSTVWEVIKALVDERGWNINDYNLLNGGRVPGDTVLQAGHNLVLKDP